MFDLNQWLPPEGVKIALVLFLSFLIGLEREERKAGSDRYTFGGVRAFPLIGLIGYSIALLAGDDLLPVTIGLVVIGGFMLLSYWHKLAVTESPGVTSEMSGLATYLVGALVYREHFWIATTLCVANLLLLELKARLEGLTTHIAPHEVLAFTKFLLLTAVILPILPNRDLGWLQVNPFRSWLVVVAVSGVSYGSYVIRRLTEGRGGIALAAVLGGAYSSTATTVVLARRARREGHPMLFTGGVLFASGVMYLRLLVLVGLFNRDLVVRLAPGFLALAALAGFVGWLCSRSPGVGRAGGEKASDANPLELGSALIFGMLFLATLAGTRLAIRYLGNAGVLGLAALMGVTDVDPFIMGLTQSAGTTAPLETAASAILIAAASNNLLKGVYAYAWSERRLGVTSLLLLGGLAALGVLPVLW